MGPIILLAAVLSATIPQKLTCAMVRASLRWYSVEQLETKAREAGVSEHEIARLKRCPR